MPKKITNPLRAGLPSKIYLLAFNGAKSGYEIAKTIYGVEKYPPTSKVSPWLKKLVNKEIISKIKTGYISNIKPLQNEIESILQTQHHLKLLDSESHILTMVLNSEEFRLYVAATNSNIPLEQDFDSAWVIMETLGMLASLILVASKLAGAEKKEVYNERDFRLLWDVLKASSSKKPELLDKVREIAEKSEKKQGKLKELMPNEVKSLESRMKMIEGYSTLFAPFIAIPPTLLKKLGNLSSSGQLFASMLLNVENLFEMRRDLG